MGILDRFKNRAVTVSSYKMIADNGNGFFAWGGNLYQSDIVRAAIRPKAQAIGKIVGKHIRETIRADGSKEIKINPDVNIRFLLEEPNPYMTGQMLQEKMAVQLELNNNAFAYIEKDIDGYPIAIYPITATNSEVLQSNGEMYLRFSVKNNRTVTFRYADIIHLRKDFNGNEMFGDSPASALTPLMEIVTTTDQGLVKAIKNSNVIKWLLKFNQTLRPEDIKKQTQDFITNYLSINSDTVGAAAVDAKMDAQQVEPKDYVPNSTQMEKTVQRIYSFFNTNEKIVQGKYNEDEWVSYYEANVEPVVMQLSGEFTRKLFTRKERGFGNKIMFESSNLTFASMQTKLNLVNYVDRGIMCPNEVRAILNMAPTQDGDTYIRRLDTAPVTQTKAKTDLHLVNSYTNEVKTYAIDFDGTLCKNLYPKIGAENANVIDFVKGLKEAGNKVILWTCRTDDLLQEAVDWCKEKGVEFDGVNENLEDIIKAYGGDTRKVVADVYVDDKALNSKDI